MYVSKIGKYKKKSKKQKFSEKHEASNSEEEWIEAELVEKEKKVSSKKRYINTSNDSVEKISKKRENQKSKYKRSTSSSSTSGSDRKKSRHFKKHLKRRYSSSDNSSEEDINRKKRNISSDKHDNSKTSGSEEQTRNKREEWMDLSTSFSSFSNEDRKNHREHEKKQQKEEEQYNPSKCSRELNPYWKNGGDGLPKFQKPKEVDSGDDSYSRYHKSRNGFVKSQSGWRKNKSNVQDIKSNTFVASKSGDSVPSGSKDCMNFSLKEGKPGLDQDPVDIPMTEKELNLLAGKLVKAEIMGNEKLVNELKEKLDSGRRNLAEMKLEDEQVLLTQTDRQGYCKPLTLNDEYMEGANHKKQRKKAMDTHKDKQRVKYFPDDDKYSLKQMFENEKFNSANNQDSEFMKIASNIRKNDDLDDLFTDNVRRMKSDLKIQEDSRSRAISEHKKMFDNVDSCPKCIQSTVMQKHLIISIGEYVYLSVPTHEPILEGHCLIVPVRHVASVTQLDENEWSEISVFRKALVRLFYSKRQEPIFFEIATGFHRYPHMVLECVPLPKAESDLAPIYFKKAIDESETEWTQNKKLVSLKGRDVRKAIPKGLPYFSVSFGMEEGLAHVIEDEKLFPKNFAQEIIGGMLDLHHSKWRKPSRQSFDEQSKRVLAFSNEWKEFDCTDTA